MHSNELELVCAVISVNCLQSSFHSHVGICVGNSVLGLARHVLELRLTVSYSQFDSMTHQCDKNGGHQTEVICIALR